MKKILVSSIIALTVALVGAASANAAFTRNLTVGSTGTDVAELQTWLISKGFSIPSISSGAATTGYFGQQTKMAVAAYQATVGLPNQGFFGPLTMAKIAMGGGSVATVPSMGCPVGYTCTANPGTTPSTPVSTTGGQEGQLRDFSTVGDVESSLDEGDEDEKVLGVEMEAEDSDMTIDRVDVDVTKSSGTASEDISDYITEVSLWLGSTKLASQDVDDADEDNDVYSFRFTGLRGVVEEDETETLYVAVSTVNNIDTGDTDGTITVGIPTDGIRATDTAGLSDTYVSSTEGADVSNGATSGDLEESFLIGAATVGDLDISEANENPDAGIIVVDATEETEDVTLFIFDLEADNEDISIEDLPIGLAVTTATNVDDVITSIALVEGSKTLKTESIPADAGAYEKITFDNLNLTIKDGETRTFKVVATVESVDSDLAVGDSIVASTTGALAGWDVEDANGESVTPDGSAAGNSLTFYESGISAKFVSATEDRNNGSIANDADSVDFTIVFDVTATGDDDVYVDGDVVPAIVSPTTATDGLSWASTTDSTTATTTSGSYAYGTATLSASGDASDDITTSGEREFKLDNGETRRFTFRVTIPAGGDNVNAGARITGIKWDTATGDSTANLYNFDMSDFKTDTITGLMIR